MKSMMTLMSSLLVLGGFAMAQEAGPQNLNKIRIHVIGLDVNDAARSQLEAIARAGGGGYHDAADEAGLVSALGSALGLPTPDMLGAEQEGNNGFAEANGVAPTGNVAGRIDPKGDVDWYAFEVDRQGLLKVLLTNVPPELDLHFRVHNGDYRVVHNWIAPLRAGAETQAELGLPGPGPYYLEVVDGKNDAASAQEYTLQMQFHPGDGNESNNSYGRATPIALDGTTYGSILPKGDEDYYVVDVPQQGTLHIALTDVSEKIDLHVRIHNAEFRVHQNWIAPLRPGADNIASIGLPSGGRYTLQVTDGKNDAYAIAPYTLTTRFDPGDKCEGNKSLGTATRIDPTGQWFASINPLGDVDCYRFEIDHPGVVNFALRNVPTELELQFRLYNAEHRVHRNWTNPLRAGADNLAVLDLPQAGTWYLMVQEAGGDAWAAEPYTLEMEYVASDRYEGNNSLATAQSIAVGQSLQASILPLGDSDWFAFEAPQAGTYQVSLTEVPEDLDLHFRLLTGAGRVVQNWVAPLRAGSDNVSEVKVPEPGRYIVLVKDGKDDARAEGSYRLQIEPR